MEVKLDDQINRQMELSITVRNALVLSGVTKVQHLLEGKTVSGECLIYRGQVEHEVAAFLKRHGFRK